MANSSGVKSPLRKQYRGYRNELATHVDAYENSGEKQGIWCMAAAFSIITAGVGSVYCFITADIDRCPRSLAERLGKEGDTCFKGCFRSVLLNAWLKD